MYSITISNAEGTLYSLSVEQTATDTDGVSSYKASLTTDPLIQPLTISLRKFDDSLGTVKLASRILSRFFRKYGEQLSLTPVGEAEVNIVDVDAPNYESDEESEEELSEAAE
jgi:hypothetical protein